MTTPVIVTYIPLMQIQFTSAYRQLTPAHKAVVDQVVRELEAAADRNGERITAALHRDVPTDMLSRDSRNMLALPLVQAAIHERINEIAAERELTPQLWIKHVMAGAFSSVGNFIRMVEQTDPATGEVTAIPLWDFSKATPEQMMAIESIEWDQKGDGLSNKPQVKMKVKMHSKATFLQMLGKYMGMVEPDNPHWRADRPTEAGRVIQANDTVDDAAARYQARLEGT